MGVHRGLGSGGVGNGTFGPVQLLAPGANQSDVVIRDFDGVKFPTRIIHREAGYPVLDVTVTGVKANIPATIDMSVFMALSTIAYLR